MPHSQLLDPLFDSGTNETIRDATPDLVVAAMEVLTHLGDGALLIVVATLLYWFGAASDRRQRALVIAIGLAALAIAVGLKGIIVRPRPELAFAPDGYPGYSFPSAHALGATAFYLTLAAIAQRGTRQLRYGLAVAVIIVVAFSRVLIGVHYPADVIAGILIGIALVYFLLRPPEPDPGPIFVLAGVIAVIAFLLGSTEFLELTIGASIGATVAWYTVARHPSSPYGASILVLGLLVLPLVILFRLLPIGIPDVHWAVEIAGFAVATAAVMVVPNVAERLNRYPAVEWLQTTLPFRGRTVEPEQVVEMVPDDD